MSSEVVLGAGIAGLLIGSFLNVVVARVPAGQSIVRPPSHCPMCGHDLRWYDNIPVISWLVLRGHCRDCHSAISIRYPLIELAAALLLAATAWRANSAGELLAFGTGFAGLLAISAVDLEVKRVPVRILYPTLGATAACFLITAAIDDRWQQLARAGTAAILGLTVLWAIHAVAPHGLGFGDVRLAALCGLLLGWRGLAFFVVGLYGAFVLGAVIGGALLAFGRGRFGRQIPFAPYLAAGCVYGTLFGAPLAHALRRWFGGN